MPGGHIVNKFESILSLLEILMFASTLHIYFFLIAYIANIQEIKSPRNLENFQSVRTGHPKVTKYQRDNFPHKRPPQNVWPSKNILSPRKCYTDWSEYYFPHKRPPQKCVALQNFFKSQKSQNLCQSWPSKSYQVP